MELNDSDFKEGDRVRIPNSNFIGTVTELSNPISLEYIREMSTRGMRVIPVKWDNSTETSIVYTICLEKIESKD